MERSKQTLLALSLAAVMLASLAGCSAQTQNEPASPPASSAAEAAQKSSAAETTAETPEDVLSRDLAALMAYGREEDDHAV